MHELAVLWAGVGAKRLSTLVGGALVVDKYHPLLINEAVDPIGAAELINGFGDGAAFPGRAGKLIFPDLQTSSNSV